MLRRNYRSHSALLALPNRLFYAQGLLAAADQQQASNVDIAVSKMHWM